MGKRLQPHFSAGVKTNEVTTIATPLGPVVQNVEVFVKGGEELPDNMADGELERLTRLGAFAPVAPLEQRVREQGARVADLLATAPEGEAVTTPGNPIGVDDELPPPPPVDGPDSVQVRHATAPQGEAVGAVAVPGEPGTVEGNTFEVADDDDEHVATAPEGEAVTEEPKAQRAHGAAKKAK